MSSFLTISAFLFAIPTLGFAAFLAHYAHYHFSGAVACGTVVDVYSRSSMDHFDELVERFYGRVTFPANGGHHMLHDYGPHDQAPAIGSDVDVRYLRKNPGKAIAWPGNEVWWLALPLIACVAIEYRILRSLLS
jgi:hypothetical protein